MTDAGAADDPALKKFIVRMENRAWPYDYPPRDVPFEAADELGARRLAKKKDWAADILSVRLSDEV